MARRMLASRWARRAAITESAVTAELQQTASPRPSSARWLFGVLLILLPLVKYGQFEELPGRDAARQALLIAGVGTAVTVATGTWRAATVWQWVFPRPAGRGWAHDWRWAPLTLGLLSIALVGAAVVSLGYGDVAEVPRWTSAALLPLGGLAMWEASRTRKGAPRPVVCEPDRAVWWTVAPAVLWWALLMLVVSPLLSTPLTGGVNSGCKLGVGGVGRALCTTVVIGFGEEYLYRGLLWVLALRAGHSGISSILLVSGGFGLWHIPDAATSGAGLAGAAGQAAGTFLLSAAVLFPLRLRSRSVVGPALVHATSNIALPAVL